MFCITTQPISSNQEQGQPSGLALGCYPNQAVPAHTATRAICSLTAKPPPPFIPLSRSREWGSVAIHQKVCAGCFPSLSRQPKFHQHHHFPSCMGPEPVFSPPIALFSLATDNPRGLDQAMAQPSHLVSAAKSSRSREARLVSRIWSNWSVSLLLPGWTII